MSEAAYLVAFDSKPQHYKFMSSNGLMRCDLIFGMVRRPAEGESGEAEVRDGIGDIVVRLRQMADTLEENQ